MLPEKCAIIIGHRAESPLLQKYIKPEEVPEDGYCIRVMKNPDNAMYNWILIAGANDTAIFYGAVDFLDHYLVQHSFYPNNNDETLEFTLPDNTHISVPKTKRRMIFAWGWSAGSCQVPSLDDSYLAEVKQSVLERFEREYAHLNVDGIYFQSFTERPDT